METPTGDAVGGSPPGAAGRANMTAHAASGLSWSSLSIAALVVANLAYTATISRLLDPTAFGLMAMANLVVLFAQYFVRMGLASALVQKPDLSDEEIRAASTAGILIGLACLGLVWLLAPAVGVPVSCPGARAGPARPRDFVPVQWLVHDRSRPAPPRAPLP